MKGQIDGQMPPTAMLGWLAEFALVLGFRSRRNRAASARGARRRQSDAISSRICPAAIAHAARAFLRGHANLERRIVSMKKNLLCRWLTAGLLFGLALAPAQAQMDQFLNNVVRETGHPAGAASDSKVGSGLKEALEVATEKAIGLTGRPNGYFGDAAIKIPMPEKLQPLEKGLRIAGMGPQVDEFVLSMNRAAEQSAPAAKQIFLDAVHGIGFEDARKILGGGNTAATEYFKGKTTGKLTAAFAPIVKRNMNEVGVTRQFEALMARMNSMPFMKSETVDIDGYVIGKALDGLFHVMGEQEKEIRENPAARTSALLKEVFAH
jgi:hypothetical protein